MKNKAQKIAKLTASEKAELEAMVSIDRQLMRLMLQGGASYKEAKEELSELQAFM